MRKESREPRQEAKAPKGETALRRFCRTVSRLLRLETRQNGDKHAPVCLEAPFAEYVDLPALSREALLTLTTPQGARIAVLPIGMLSDYLKYPLPEQAVRQLTATLLQPAAVAITIRLLDDERQSQSGEGSRFAVFCDDQVAGLLLETLA